MRKEDFKLTSIDLIRKYNLPEDIANLDIILTKQNEVEYRESKMNVIFEIKYHTIFKLLCSHILQPQTLFYFIATILTIIFYATDQSERQVIFASSLSIAILIFRLLIMVYVEIKIDNLFKRRLKYPNQIIKDGKITTVNQEYLKVGDILHLVSGDIVGADCILIASRNLTVDIGILDDNDNPIEKRNPDSTDIFEQSQNVLTAGDKILSGTARGLVVGVGKETALYKLNSKIKQLNSYNSNLETEMKIFTAGSIVVGLIFSLVIIPLAAISVRKPKKLFSLALSIILAVSPDGIGIALKILQFTIISKLADKNIIVRDKAIIEKFALVTTVVGSKSCFVSSEIKMIECIYDGNSMVDVELAFEENDSFGLEAIKTVSRFCYLLIQKEFNPSFFIMSKIYKQHFFEDLLFDSIEQIEIQKLKGLMVGINGQKLMILQGDIPKILYYCRSYRSQDGQIEMDDTRKNKILRLTEKMVLEGYNPIAIASKMISATETMSHSKDLCFECVCFSNEQISLNLFILRDVLKATQTNFCLLSNTDTKSHLNICRKILNLKEIVLEKLGQDLIRRNERNKICKISDYQKMNLDEKNHFLENGEFIIYKVNVNQKKKIVKDLEKMGHVVLYVGDELTDYGALKEANLSISFGSSCPISKQTSGVVITNNLADIIFGLQEGRLFFTNLKKSLRFICLRSIPQLIHLIMFAIFGSPLGLNSFMSIILNYFVELLPVRSFAFEEAEVNLLEEPSFLKRTVQPITETVYEVQNISESIKIQFKKYFQTYLKIISEESTFPFYSSSHQLLENGIICGVACSLSFYFALFRSGIPFNQLFFSNSKIFVSHPTPILNRQNQMVLLKNDSQILFKARSTFFISLVICQFFNAFICRREKKHFFYKFFTNSSLFITTFGALFFSLALVYTNALVSIFFMSRPDMLMILFPATACVLIIMIDTCRKYRLSLINSST